MRLAEMLPLKQLFGLVKGSHRKASDSILRGLPPEENRRDPIWLLAVAEDQELLRTLEEIARSCNWKLARVLNVNGAVKTLESEPIRLVVLDHDPHGQDWRIAMRRFYMLPDPVCVFVASRVADRYMWDEVVRNHGYDVFPKPLRRDEVIRSVELAWYWRAWERQWTGDRKRG